jgi:hypothetical protein
MGERGLDWAGSRQGQVANSSEHGNLPSVFIKWGEFLDYAGTISFSTWTCCMELFYRTCIVMKIHECSLSPEVAKYCASLCLFIGAVNILDLFFMAQQSLVGQGPLFIEASQSHSDTSHSAGLLWMSDQPVAKTSSLQNTTLIRDRRLCPRRDSKPQSEKARGRRPTPSRARPLGSAVSDYVTSNDRMTNASEELWKKTALLGGMIMSAANLPSRWPGPEASLEPATSRTVQPTANFCKCGK